MFQKTEGDQSVVAEFVRQAEFYGYRSNYLNIESTLITKTEGGGPKCDTDQKCRESFGQDFICSEGRCLMESCDENSDCDKPGYM